MGSISVFKKSTVDQQQRRISSDYTVDEQPSEMVLIQELESGRAKPLVFVLNANLLAMVKLVNCMFPCLFFSSALDNNVSDRFHIQPPMHVKKNKKQSFPKQSHLTTFPKWEFIHLELTYPAFSFNMPQWSDSIVFKLCGRC